MKLLFCTIFPMFLSVACTSNRAEQIPQVSEVIEVKNISELEQKMIDAGLVNVQNRNPSILVELKYSTKDNFIGEDVYGDLENAYLQPDVFDKLQKAYQYLQDIDTTLTFLIYDATRPLSVQQKMYDILYARSPEKIKYVSNPKNGSVHNYGAALDITLANRKGDALDMGSPFDYFGDLAEPQLENSLFASGKLTETQIKNRKLLRSVMVKAGFRQLQSEWWHYNSCSRNEAKQKYELIE